MKGTPEVVDGLRDVLKAELTAIMQYFLHAEMCENWGYFALSGYMRKESFEEMRHAESLIERILYFDAIPNLRDMFALRIGKDVKEQLENDLALELEAVDRLNKCIATAVEKGDNGSRELFEKILVDEEHHVDWLEGQVEQIDQMGIQNYLAQQRGGNEGGGN